MIFSKNSIIASKGTEKVKKVRMKKEIKKEALKKPPRLDRPRSVFTA